MPAGTTSPAAAASIRITAGSETITLPTRRVRAITRIPPVTRVPHAPASMVGVANVAGTVLPVVSLAQLLQQPETSATRLIVFEAMASCGLLVDRVDAVVGDDADQDDGSDGIDQRLAAVFATLPGSAAPVPRTDGLQEKTDDKRIALLSFRIGRQEFALPAREVSEVLRAAPALTPVPEGPPVALGLFEHRGEVLPVLSLAALLNLADGGKGPAPAIVIAIIGGYRVGLAVDALGGILHARERSLDPVPAVLRRGAVDAPIQAICRVEEGRRLVSVIAAEALVDQALMSWLHQQTGRSTMAHTGADQATQPFLTFRIGDRELALPVEAVDEIFRLPPSLTRLPTAPASVVGALNLRGRVIPIIDHWNVRESRPDRAGRNPVIVVRAGASRAGFIVDTVADVLRVPEGGVARTAEPQGASSPLFDGTVTLGGAKWLPLVSPQALLNGAEREIIAHLGDAAAVLPA